MKKPSSCIGCPFYGDGNGFVPDEVREGALIFNLAQNPGEDEEYEAKPKTGATGAYQAKHFFPLAGITRDSISLGNALRCRVGSSNDLPELKEERTRQAITHCTQAHFHPPDSTKLFIAEGAYALWALTGKGVGKGQSVSDWRGYVLPYNLAPRMVQSVDTDIWTPTTDKVVLATMHTAMLFRDMSMYPVLQHDWSKVPMIQKGTWPTRLPAMEHEPPLSWPKEMAFDTEFTYDDDDPDFVSELIRYSVSDGKRVWVIEAGQSAPNFVGDEHIIVQNRVADWPYLDKMGFVGTVDDTMMAHSVLWTDLDHNLNFLGSLFAPTNRWKHLSAGNPRVYSGADGWNTWYVWKALAKSFKLDPASEKYYREILLPVWPLIYEAKQKGLRVNQDRVEKIRVALTKRAERAMLKAQAAVGWPINVGSPNQVAHELFNVQRVRG